MTIEHVDVLIVGAGISGIGAGYHLQQNCPNKSWLILEGRADIGGTWDLFRYPGIRSDSDMYTLGYSFQPWTEAKAIADGPSILNYLRRTAKQYRIDERIRFHHHVTTASWSGKDALWTVETQFGPDKEPRIFTCNFLFMCSGYYRYSAGFTPEFKGINEYSGQIIHPQLWPEAIDYANKRVVVIGSGATAVTLVPEMAKTAAHVTMLQRSPTYIISRPSTDSIANRLRRIFPTKMAYGITRWKNVLQGMLLFTMSRKRPEKIKARILGAVRDELGPDYDVATHFTPRYNPWDQRMCLVPDGDLFKAMRSGSADIVTDQISHFTQTGLALQSGKKISADIIVTATGLELELLGGIKVVVDGVTVDPSQSYGYKGMMYSGIPNLASSFGYTNASWTLKADLTCKYVCRLLNHMDSMGVRQCTPILTDNSVEPEPFLDFNSGYVVRSLNKFPKQGSKRPWKVHQNYALDIISLGYGKVEDGTMQFSNPVPKTAVAS